MEDPSLFYSFFGEVIIRQVEFLDLMTLLAIAVCLYFSGFFSGSEVSFFSLLPAQIEELKGSAERRDSKILEMIDNPERLLGTLLVANNLVNIAIITLANYLVGRIFDFSRAPAAGFAIQVIGTTFVILLIGEIIPKVISQKDPLGTARRNVAGIARAESAFRPIVRGLVRLGALVTKPLSSSKSELDHEELSRAIELTTDDDDEKGVLNEIILFHKKDVSEVMQPRMEVAAIEIDESFGHIKHFIIENGYSRMPIYEDRIDNIKGILYAKDLLPRLREPDDFDWRGLIREAMFVPETMMVSHLLEDFRRERIHMAIVVDEYGGTSGVVTMEDLLEEIVGEINDEYDDEEKLYTANPDGTFLLDGKMSILDFLRAVRVDNYEEIIRETDEAETLGGLLLEIKEDFPQVGEEIFLEGHSFKVVEMGRRRISKILFTPNALSPRRDDGGADSHETAH